MLFVKAQVARKRVILHKSFFHKSCLDKCWELMAMFHLLKLRTSIGLFRYDKCKLTFGLKYIYVTSLVMTLKNTDQVSAKLIRQKFNMLVLTIRGDLVGLCGYQITTKNNNLLSLCPKKYLGFKPTEKKVFWQKKQRWS